MRRMIVKVLTTTTLVALCGMGSVVAAELPPAISPSAAASSAAREGPLAAPATRVPQPPRSLADPGPENAVIPQIDVPLKRGERKPTLVRPHLQTSSHGGVDDSVARCLADSVARRAECGPTAAAVQLPKAAARASSPSAK